MFEATEDDKTFIKGFKYFTRRRMCSFICYTVKITKYLLIIYIYDVAWRKTLNIKHEMHTFSHVHQINTILFDEMCAYYAQLFLYPLI